MKLENLSLPFHLSDTDLTGELWHSQAASLQAEGAMQGSLTAAPDVVERDLLLAKNNVNKEETNGLDYVSKAALSWAAQSQSA